ncbi:hypothetical protein HOY82DRAFT_556017, partial [Tuber indicum]
MLFFFCLFSNHIFIFFSAHFFFLFSCSFFSSLFPSPPFLFAFSVCLAAFFFSTAMTLRSYHWQCGNLRDFVWNSGYGVSVDGNRCKGSGCLFRKCAWWKGIICSGSGFFHVQFLHCVLSLPFFFFSCLFSLSSTPITREIFSRVFHSSLFIAPPSMIDGVLDFFPFIWSLWPCFFLSLWQLQRSLSTHTPL